MKSLGLTFSKDSLNQYGSTSLKTYGRDVVIEVFDIYYYSLGTDGPVYYLPYRLEGNNNTTGYLATLSEDMKIL